MQITRDVQGGRKVVERAQWQYRQGSLRVCELLDGQGNGSVPAGDSNARRAFANEPSQVLTHLHMGVGGKDEGGELIMLEKLLDLFLPCARLWSAGTHVDEDWAGCLCGERHVIILFLQERRGCLTAI